MGRADIVVALVKSGLSYTEAGRRVGVTKGTVAGLVYRWRHPWVPKKRDWSVDRRADDWSVVLVETWAERKARLTQESKKSMTTPRVLADPLSPDMRRRVETAVRLFPIDSPSLAEGLEALTPLQQQVYVLYESGLLVPEISAKVECEAGAVIGRIRVKGYPLKYRQPPINRRDES